MSRLAVAVVIVMALSACQAWDSRDAGRYSDYGYSRGPGWYHPLRPYPYYAAPFGYERHLARERWLAEERRRRAARHDDRQPESPGDRGGGRPDERDRPGVKLPPPAAAAVERDRMRAARQQAIEAQRQRKQGLPPKASPRREVPASGPGSAEDKTSLK